MPNRHTSVRARDKTGKEFALSATQTDAPLLPDESLRRLHEYRPDLVDWVIKQTEIEAETRRREQRRINTFEFIERMAGIASALLIAVAGIAGAIYAGLHGHDWLGGTIATLTIGSLAINFLVRRTGSKD